MRLHDKLNQVICQDPDSPRIIAPSAVVKQVYLYKQGMTLGRYNGKLVKLLGNGVWFIMNKADVPKNVTVH